MSDLTTYSFHMGCILKVLVYIEENLDSPLPLEKLAGLAHISPFYFHRLFHAYMGETLADYIKRIRLQRAADRLKYSKDPITDIALDIGYETPSSFSTVFSQVMGQSPRKYRQQMQPLVQDMIKRTIPNQKSGILKAQYLILDDMQVLFARRTGDYRITPWEAFDALTNFIEAENISPDDILGFFSSALDDPTIVSRDQCRFDACVALKCPLKPKGEIGERTLRRGRFAVFNYIGPYAGIENEIDEIIRYWYPSADVKLSEMPTICEHLDFLEPIADEKRVTKIYIPLKN